MDKQSYPNVVKGLKFIIIGAVLTLIGETLVSFFYGDNLFTIEITRRTVIIVGEFVGFFGSIIELVGIIIVALDRVKHFKFSLIIKIISTVFLTAEEMFYFSGNFTLQEIAKVIGTVSPIWEMLVIMGIIFGCQETTGNKDKKLDKIVLVLVIITTVIELWARSFGGYFEKINFYSNAGIFIYGVFCLMVIMEIFIELAHITVLIETEKELKAKLN